MNKLSMNKFGITAEIRLRTMTYFFIAGFIALNVVNLAFATGAVSASDLAGMAGIVDNLVSIFGLVLRVIGVVWALIAVGKLMIALNSGNGSEVQQNAQQLGVAFILIVAKPILEGLNLSSYLTT